MHNHPLLLNGSECLGHRWSITSMHTKDDHMYKTFIAGLTAISLTLSSAAPARANSMNEDQIGKILFGLLATGVLVNIINNKQQSKTPPVATTRPWAPPVVAPHPHSPRTVDVSPRPPAPRIVDIPRRPRGARNAKIIPRDCLKNFEGRFGNYRMFQRSCMRENYQFVRSLPQTCKVRLVTRKGTRNGWDPRCLRQAGYIASRR
jgi:hypothetical protein